MVEAYVAEESIELCSEVLKGIPPVSIPKYKNIAKRGGIFGPYVECVDSKLIAQAHLYVLRKSDVIRPYVDTHMDIICQHAQELGKGLRWVANEHNRTFPSWLSVKVSEEMQSDPRSINETLKWLSYSPRPIVLRYNGFVIKGRRFYTESRDASSTIQNSGVIVAAHSMNVSRASDNNPNYRMNHFYGKVEQIWEVDYAKFLVYKCKWANNSAEVRVDNMGFITVNFNRIGHTNDAFILTEQAMQVFYVRDSFNHALSIALSYDTPRSTGFDDTVNVEDQYLSSTAFRKFCSSAEDNDDEPNYHHGSNEEGVLLRKSRNKRKSTVTYT